MVVVGEEIGAPATVRQRKTIPFLGKLGEQSSFRASCEAPARTRSRNDEGRLRPQHVPMHLAAVEMEERHVRVVAKRPGGQAAVEFAEHVLGHGVRIGERL